MSSFRPIVALAGWLPAAWREWAVRRYYRVAGARAAGPGGSLAGPE